MIPFIFIKSISIYKGGEAPLRNPFTCKGAKPPEGASRSAPDWREGVVGETVGFPTKIEILFILKHLKASLSKPCIQRPELN
jgi:hypothetical protein